MNKQKDSDTAKARYFLGLGRTVGKREQHGDFLYALEQGWVHGYRHEISDRLMGYDETEPADSPIQDVQRKHHGTDRNHHPGRSDDSNFQDEWRLTSHSTKSPPQSYIDAPLLAGLFQPMHNLIRCVLTKLLHHSSILPGYLPGHLWTTLK
ncbi:hypothetical protein [Bifidobacterium asteroides]|uniref:hypothetical protein n=1 Tax=Bifidobacterium asteroides TaxID=1684 RepID=UPI003A80837F